MKLFGVGTDIIQVNRLKKSLKKKPFLSRIFNDEEIIKCKRTKKNSNCFAKRFAAKEAFVKSIGTGFRSGINFSDIIILNNKLGKPYIRVNNKIKSIICKKNKLRNFKVFLSLSDEAKHSIAYVILSRSKK